MKSIVKNAVGQGVHPLVWLRDNEPEKYRVGAECGAIITGRWDEPKFDFTFRVRRSAEASHRLNRSH